MMSKPLTYTMNPAKSALTKVPGVTIIFWIIKLLSTGMGEAASDFLSHLGSQDHMGGPPSGGSLAKMSSHPNFAMGHGPGGAQSGMSISFTPFIGIMCAVLILTMILQIRSKHYVPWKYWLNVAVVAVFGTAAADAVRLGSTMITSIVFGAILVIVLAAWYVVEKTLSVHEITTTRREIFYWATVLATFMLGTALGDFTAFNLNLGTLVSGFMFIGLIAIPAIAYKFFHRNEIFCFWFAYILTRPLGASFADWLDGRDGLNLGTGPVSLVSIIIIVALVIYVSIAYKKEKEAAYKLQLT